MRASRYTLLNKKDQVVEFASKGMRIQYYALLPLLRTLRLLWLSSRCCGERNPGNIREASILCGASSPQQSTLVNLGWKHVIDFVGVDPFLDLPTVQSLPSECCAEGDFEWPSSLPTSHVKFISLINNTVSSKAIRGLASGIVGPYVIRFE